MNGESRRRGGDKLATQQGREGGVVSWRNREARAEFDRVNGVWKSCVYFIFN